MKLAMIAARCCALFLLVACGQSIEEKCQDFCEERIIECPEVADESCRTQCLGSDDVAEAAGCEAESHALWDCVAEVGACGDWLSGCSLEQEALRECGM